MNSLDKFYIYNLIFVLGFPLLWLFFGLLNINLFGESSGYAVVLHLYIATIIVVFELPILSYFLVKKHTNKYLALKAVFLYLAVFGLYFFLEGMMIGGFGFFKAVYDNTVLGFYLIRSGQF